jgi:hypothetical protein
MRPLKRPMFKTGGPIKEGVMNGLRDGGVATTMADATMMAGGGMPNMRGRVTGPGGYAGDKVGFFRKAFDPRKSAGSSLLRRGNALSNDIFALIMGAGMLPMKNGGVASLANRPGYSFGSKVLKKMGPVANIYNKGIANIKKLPNFFASKMTKSVPNVVRDKSGRVISEGTIAVPTYFGRDPGVKTIGAIYKGITSPTAKGFAQKAAQYATSPTALLAGATFSDVLPGGKPLGKDDSGLFGFGNLLGQKYDKDGKKMTGVFGRDIGYNKEKVLTEEQKRIKALEDQLAALNKKKTPGEIKKLEEDKLKRIYSLLGVDRAKRGAASKALIDMSRYIDEGGKDTISRKNIGSTISKAIGAFDKRLDKVDQLKEAAGLMMAKGEIEAMSNPLDKKYKQVMIDAKLRELNPTVLDQKALLDVKGQTLTHDRAATIAKRTYPNAVILADAKKAKDEGIGDEKTVVEYVAEQIKTQGGDVAGVYVVDKSIVQVDTEGNIKQII